MSIVVSSSVTYRTALDILKRALRMLGVYSTGDDLSAEEARDGLLTLNALMGTLSNTGLVFAKTLDTISVAAGTQSLTIGTSGDTVSARPTQILPESYFLLDGVSYPLEVFTLQKYNSIALKTVEGIPVGVWPHMDAPNVTLTFWPVPSEDMTLKLWSAKPMAGLETLNEQVLMPPGYEDGLAYLLAEAVAPEYGVNMPRAVELGAQRSRRLLKRTNLEVPLLSMPSEVLGRPHFVDIRLL